jgi:hypothetical protein
VSSGDILYAGRCGWCYCAKLKTAS